MTRGSSAVRASSIVRNAVAALIALAGAVGLAAQSAPAANGDGRVATVDTAPVPLNARNPWQAAVGDFTYAGGLVLTSSDTDQLHGLSDLDVSGMDRLSAVSDSGTLVETRLVLDTAERLVGLADLRLTRLVGLDGRVPPEKTDADAEGLALLPNGDRLVSFEVHDRVWLYPANGAAPRAVPSPNAAFPSNVGLEALSLDPAAGPDAYVVGAEESGQTWNCRISLGRCVPGAAVVLPRGFALVSMRHLPGRRVAYLLRAFDVVRGNRSVLRIQSDSGVVAQLDLALPLTLDNYEGVAAVTRADGSVRFYLISDDNARSFQRTLLVAFDWRPR